MAMRRPSLNGGKKEGPPRVGAAATGSSQPPAPQPSPMIARDGSLCGTSSASPSQPRPAASTKDRVARSRSPQAGSAGAPATRPLSPGVNRKNPATTTANPPRATPQGASRGAGSSAPVTPRTPRTPLTTPRSGTGGRRVSSPTAGGRGVANTSAAGSVSPGRRQARRTTSNHRRQLHTGSPVSSKGTNSRKNSGANEGSAPPGHNSCGAPLSTSATTAPTHLQQLQAPPKKPSQESRGLKTSRDLRKETQNSSGVNPNPVCGLPTALLSSSRSMAPIVHIRVRPLLPFFNESNDMRKVWFLDHENMVVRAPPGTNNASNQIAASANNTTASSAAGVSSGNAVGAAGGGGGAHRLSDRRPTLPPPKSKGAGNHSFQGNASNQAPPLAGASQQPQPQPPSLQQPLHARSQSSPSLESSVVLIQADKNANGESSTTPHHVPLGLTGVSGAAIHCRSVSEQSLLSDQLGSDRTSGGRLSTSSPPALHLLQHSASSSVSATSTPRPQPKLTNFFPGVRGGRAAPAQATAPRANGVNDSINSQRTSPGQEALGNTTVSAPSPMKTASTLTQQQHQPLVRRTSNSVPGRGILGGGAKPGANGKRRDSRFKEGKPGTPGASIVLNNTFGTGVDLPEPGVGNEQHFNFAFIHDESATQEEVFEDSVLRFADEALLAQNITILCYGPTGSGKTFSMMGNTSSASGAVGATGISRRASMATGVFHGRTGSYGANAAPSPSKSGSRQSQPQPANNASGAGVAVAEGENMNKVMASEALEDSIAQVSEEDTDDDEWPLFDHTWYRDRQRRAQLMDSAHGAGAYGRAADNMRTTEMGILPRLVLVLLDRRNDTVILNTIETAGTATPFPGVPPGLPASERSASIGSTPTSGTARRTPQPQPPPLPPPPPPSMFQQKRRRGQGPPTRCTISLTLRELTFYGIELYCDELSDLMDPGKRPITNVSDMGGLAAMCTRLNQAREDAVRAATAAATAGTRASAAARANTGGGLPIESLEDLRKAYRLARRNRVTAPHARNERSSRSHAVFVLQLRFELAEETVDTSTGEVLHENRQPLDSYVAMVDLAGSERLKESQVESGQALREAQYINKSLSALSSVVLALYQRSSHIPYRDSKLTRMLRPCLEGGRVLILVHVAPCSGVNTLNTLKFADQIRHTMVQTHNFAGDANKRGLLNIFEDLIDPEQAKMEAAYTQTQEKYDQLCAEVRLALLSRSMLLDSSVVARNSASYSALCENSTTLTMSRVSSSRSSLAGENVLEEGAGRAHVSRRHSSPSPSATRDDTAASGVQGALGLPRLTADASPATLRTFRIHSLVNRHFAPLKESEDAGVQEAIRDIALERDRRVEAAKRKLELEALNLRAAIDEMTRYNAQLARENASPVSSDPYYEELSRQVRALTEEVREKQSHNMIMKTYVNVLRQRISAQEDIEAGVNADVEEMRSKGLLPMLPSRLTSPPPQIAADASLQGHMVGGNQQMSSSPPSALATSQTASGASSLTYVDTEVATDAEMREIGYQQVLLAQELSALRMEAACYAMGDGIWEGLWARALRQELLTAARVEVALMEKVLLDRDVLRSLAASADALAKCEVGAIEDNTTTRRQGAAEEAGGSTPPSPAAGGTGRRKPSPGQGRKMRSGNNSFTAAGHGAGSNDSDGSTTPTLQQLTTEALASVEIFLSQQQQEARDGAGGPHHPASVHSDGEDAGGKEECSCQTLTGRASGEQANKDADEGARSRMSTSGSGLLSSVVGATMGGVMVDIPNPLEVAFYTQSEATRPANTAVVTPSTPAMSVARSSSMGVTTTASGASPGTRRSSLAETVASAYTPVSLVGSYNDEERLQRMSVLKLLADGIVCEAVCVGDDFEAVASSLLPSSTANTNTNNGGSNGNTSAAAATAAGRDKETEDVSGNTEESNRAAAGDNGGGERASLDDVRHQLNSSPSRQDSRRGSTVGAPGKPDKPGKSQRNLYTHLPMTKHFGRLRLVRRVAKGGAAGVSGGSARRGLIVPERTTTSLWNGSSDPHEWIPAEEGAVYCLEFVYSHHGIPLAPRVADAIAAAVTPSPKSQLEELVDSLPSPMDVRRAYTPTPSHSKALSPSAAALLKERRLFSVPLNEPQLSVDLHLLEAGAICVPTVSAPGAENAGASDGGEGSPLTTGRSSPNLSVPETSRAAVKWDEESTQLALELHGIPLSNANALANSQKQQLGGRTTPYQQYVGGGGGDDAGMSTGGGTSAMTPPPAVGKDVVLAKRLREGGELLLPSPCILPNKGTCTLLLRFPGAANVNGTRLESVEAIVAALCGVMPPAVVGAATTPAPTRTSSPSKAARNFRTPSPADLPLETSKAEVNVNGGGGVVCHYPHIPHVLLFPNPAPKDDDTDGRVGDADKSGGRYRDVSPDPRKPPTPGKKGTGGGGAHRRGSHWTGDSMGGLADCAAVRGAALRVHMHFPGTLGDNAITLATIAADGVGNSGELGAVKQAIVSAATLLQGLRIVTVGPFMDSGEGVAACSPATPSSQFSSSSAVAARGSWRVAQRLQQLHAFNRNIRSLIKQQIFEAEDIKGDILPDVGGVRASPSGSVSGLQLRAVVAEAREALGTFFGGGRGADGTFGGTLTNNGSTLNTPGRGSPSLQPYATYGGGGVDTCSNSTGATTAGGHGVLAVKGVVSLGQARELGGAVLPWTLWQWAFRWRAITALCTQLERSAALASAVDPRQAPPLLMAGTVSSLGGTLDAAGALQVQQYLQGLLGPIGSPRSGAVAGFGFLAQPTFAAAAGAALGSPVGLPLTAAAGGSLDVSPASLPPGAAPEGSPALEPIMLPSASDEEDMFNSFGHGNWIAESAAMSAGTAAQKTVWLPELSLSPAPDFLASLAVEPSLPPAS